MTKIIIIEKTGVVKEVDIKIKDLNELYKKAGFKTAQGFELQTTWNIPSVNGECVINLYGNKEGRAGQENKYDFPPPVDEELFFGNCILIRKEDDEFLNLTKEIWNESYEYLFGGFEDLDDEDSELSEDDVDDDDVSCTKEGYVKDGFIVEDSEDEEEEDVESEDEEEEDVESEENDFSEEENTKRKMKKTAKPVQKNNKQKHKKNEVVKPCKQLKNNTNLNYLNCSDELEVEEYV